MAAALTMAATLATSLATSACAMTVAGTASAVGPAAGLDSAAVPDECLLDTTGFGLLLGRSVDRVAPAVTTRPDGTRSSSCIATAGDEPVGAIDVYAARSGSPADYVRGAHRLTGLPGAADVLDTPTGPMLQVAAPRYLVTILVTGATPTDDQWRIAAILAVTKLGVA